MIVSDATAIIVLINIDKFELFEMIFERIIVTQEVYDEVSIQASAKKFIDNEIQKGFVVVESYRDKQAFKEISYILDKGEASSIVLAMEKEMPLIIDEKKGRRFARQCGIDIMGLVGILRFVYLQKMVKRQEMEKIVEALNQSNFRISKELMQRIMD